MGSSLTTDLSGRVKEEEIKLKKFKTLFGKSFHLIKWYISFLVTSLSSFSFKVGSNCLGQVCALDIVPKLSLYWSVAQEES